MGEIWLGWNIIVGVVIVVLVESIIAWMLARRIWKKVRAKRDKARLVDAGFTWEYGVQGWVSRDPYNNDLILWDERNEQMLRLPDQERAGWKPSEENFQQCVDLGRKYRIRTAVLSHGQV